MVSDIERMNRKLRRKRIRKIVGFIFAVIVAVPVTIILMRTFLRTNSILIENGTQYSSASLLSSCSEYIGGTILDFESDTDKLFPPEEFPYIASAEVSVLLPDKMVVRLTRSVPTISVLTADGSYIYLDSDKKVLEISDRKGAGTVLISGMELQNVRTGYVLDKSENYETSLIDSISESLRAHSLYDRLTLMDFTKKYDIYFVLDNLIEVRIGNSDDIDKKIDMLVQILARNPSGERAVINVKNYKEGRYKALD
ncbi:MAG: hypothetical protein E7481_07975 [Ruminococcaceae bacterium]|nr:hypothetical protein [Oscillospiraceae bacterium]